MKTLDLPDSGTTESDDSEPVHYYCCSEELALCGIRLDESYLSDNDDDIICALCEFVLHEIGADIVCIGGCAFVRL